MTGALSELDVVAPEPGADAPYRSWWRTSLRESLRYGRTRLGLALTAFVVLLAIFGPLFAPHSVSELVGAPFAPPSSEHLLGTDYVGEDVFSRVLSGGRYILWMSIAAGLIGTVGGTILGVVAGYSRGWLDDLIMRALDVLLAIPVMILVLLFLSMLGSNPFYIVALVGIAWMPTVARTTRAATTELARREFIEAAETLGKPRWRILTQEVVPNLMTLILVEFGIRCAWSIAIIAGISYLGFGIAPPAADWGLMINENSVGLSVQPWGVAAPAVCVALFALGVGLIAEGLALAVAGVDRKGT